MKRNRHLTAAASAADPAALAKQSYFVLRIALENIRPSIWRRVAVPGNITLDLLHDVLQVAMGWEDCHLHEFTIDDRRYTEDPEGSEQGLEETGLALMNLLSPATGKKTAFDYLYDFGDGWEHTIKVEKVAQVPAGNEFQLTCLGGKRRCPPEDVGGPWGYAEYLNALADPRHEAHREKLAWRGPFDPEAFDIESVNRELAKLQRWSRNRIP